MLKKGKKSEKKIFFFKQTLFKKIKFLMSNN